jgi:hypothetical protein
MIRFWILQAILSLSESIDNSLNPPVIVPAKNSTSAVTDSRDWIEIIKFHNECQKSHDACSLEIDLDITVIRPGIFGFLLDMFSIDSVFDIAISSIDRTSAVHMMSPFEGPGTKLVLTITTSDDILVLFRNRNSHFAVTPYVLGDIFTSRDVFDLRSKYPDCQFPVYMQGICGACYADVVAGAGTDMACMAGNNRVKRLSPQPLISCSNLGGCSGGSPYLAALWTSTNGLLETTDCPFVSIQCEPEIDALGNGCIDCDRVMSGIPASAPSYHFSPIVLMPVGTDEGIRRHIQTRGSVMVIFEAHANFQEFFLRQPFGV